jgi:hypothetical protein
VEKKPIPQETKEAMVHVLREFVNLGVIGRACDNAGVPRGTHKKWLEEYPKYKERFEEVREMFVDGLEMIAIQRAKERSDSLLTLMLKAHRREVYGDRADVNHTLSGKQIQLIFAEGMLTDEEKKMLQGEEQDNGESSQE